MNTAQAAEAPALTRDQQELILLSFAANNYAAAVKNADAAGCLFFHDRCFRSRFNQIIAAELLDGEGSLAGLAKCAYAKMDSFKSCVELVMAGRPSFEDFNAAAKCLWGRYQATRSFWHYRTARKARV